MAAAVVVVDASAVVDLLVNGGSLPVNSLLIAPAHLDAEVLSALGRLCRHGTLVEIDVEEMLDDLVALPVERVPIKELTLTAFTLRHNVSLRDGIYVALAQVADAALHTVDNGLARACADYGLCSLSVSAK